LAAAAAAAAARAAAAPAPLPWYSRPSAAALLAALFLAVVTAAALVGLFRLWRGTSDAGLGGRGRVSG